MTEYVAVDLETTGLSPYKAKIIEIGAVRFQNGKETDRFSILVDPGMPLPERIIELTGIRDEMLHGQPGEKEAVRSFLEFAGDSVLLGHNLIFDYSFLKYVCVKHQWEFERKGIDTLAIAKKHLADLPSRSLPDLCCHYRIDSGDSHRALSDARSAALLYELLREKYGEISPIPLNFQVKKAEPMTAAQKNYLNDLIKYHKIECNVSFDTMTKSEASRMIDKIILERGKPIGHPRGKNGADHRNAR